MDSPAAVACREVFDENSQPSAEEISDYAQQLGIDPESESHLLPLAKDGLMQALPAPWKAFYDEKVQAHYYFNEDTKKTQWEHPLDNVYRELVRKARDASMHDDTYISVQELLTSEENTKHLERIETKVESDDDDLTTDSESQSEIKEVAKQQGVKRLAPLGRPPLAPLSRPMDRKLGDLRISPLRRSVDSSFSLKPGMSRMEKDIGRVLERPKFLKQQSEIIDLKMHVVNSAEEENFNLFAIGKGEKVLKSLPLTGKGSMFLRAKKPDLPSPDTEKSITIDSVTKSDPPKGILREKMADSLYRKVESLSLGKPRHTASFEDDRKSVRFKLENTTVETTVSPGSNSSSNDGQSSIISATPTNLPFSPLPPTSVPLNQTSSMPTISAGAPIVLSPLAGRPPLPPRPSSVEQLTSPRDVRSVSESVDSDSRESRGASPRRRVLRPPAADYIKQDLFQKSFHKIADLVKPGDIEPSAVHLEEPGLEKEARPRSPMIPQINKISINLMESIESETSIDSPDREFANLDLNDMDDSKNDLLKSENDKEQCPKDTEEEKDNSERITSEYSKLDSNRSNTEVLKAQTKVPKLEFLAKPQIKNLNSESEDSKKYSFREESRNSKSESVDKNLETNFSNIIKISPNPSVMSLPSDLRSPKSESIDRPTWSPLSFKPGLNKTLIGPQIKSSDSNPSLVKGFTSPRLDGVVISQGKSLNRGSDNVVVMYQFDTPKDDSYPKQTIKSSTELAKDMLERNKADERKRLELSLQKVLEDMRVEWAGKEKIMRMELQEELRAKEEKFKEEKRLRLLEQADRLRKEMEEALQVREQAHQDDLAEADQQRRARVDRETQLAEREFREQMDALREEHARHLDEEKQALESESERALAELRSQLQATLHRERARAAEESKLILDALRDEQSARVNELRHDYRAEVERLRTQHACHLEEIRARLASERAAATRRGNNDALADKYRCLKEKYARLKRDVKMSIERRNKRREMSMTTGSETEKSNSHKATQSLDRCKEVNETSTSAVLASEPPRLRVNNNPVRATNNDNETSLSESNALKSQDNNNLAVSPESSHTSCVKSQPRSARVAFREPPRRRHNNHRDNRDAAANTDFQDSSDATTADERPKEPINGHGRRRCFTRLKSASTSRLNYSPKRGDGWSSPLEALRQQLRKLDDLEEQFPDLACQPAYSLPYPFTDLRTVSSADTPELEFVRHRALVEREGMRRARAALRRRRAALYESRAGDTEPEEEREATELEVALHRARALLGEKEIRLRHIERALRRIAESPPPQAGLQACASDGSSGDSLAEAAAAAPGAVLRSLRALHADVRDIWRALDVPRPAVSLETSSCNAATSPQPRISLSAHEPARPDTSDGGVAERARGLRAWLHTAP